MYPEVVVIPINAHPVFPEFLKYIEVDDKNLIRKLRSLMKARQPYAGVFLRKIEFAASGPCVPR